MSCELGANIEGTESDFGIGRGCTVYLGDLVFITRIADDVDLLLPLVRVGSHVFEELVRPSDA